VKERSGGRRELGSAAGSRCWEKAVAGEAKEAGEEGNSRDSAFCTAFACRSPTVGSRLLPFAPSEELNSFFDFGISPPFHLKEPHGEQPLPKDSPNEHEDAQSGARLPLLRREGSRGDGNLTSFV